MFNAGLMKVRFVSCLRVFVYATFWSLGIRPEVEYEKANLISSFNHQNLPLSYQSFLPPGPERLVLKSRYLLLRVYRASNL